ncbi:putative Cell cycle serine/threonine-protein kinase CDC5/MSD2 [Blattamonas nauphoetae]|uniref:non-specific serine/threonine protein kinase n=1 Tax=Blattamonas nauphoetae TaxID=2049346 RepID=A0ABQ9Y0G3_9EUKA|nr:putative Cell cycle serine/threonine-protein kinase CDC5/MSD2 [Blattamonas nauphoetae]
MSHFCCDTIIEQIGCGSFGIVFKAKKDDKLFALKRIPREQDNYDQVVKEIQNMVTFQKSETNPDGFDGCVHFYECFELGNHYYLVMELCENGTLEKLLEEMIQNQTSFPEKTLWDFACELSDSLVVLKQKRIIHKDIKPENIFIGNDDKLKLGDMGLSSQKTSTLDPTYIGRGTPRFKAPEIVMGKSYDIRCDVWSLGVTLYLLTEQQYPFPQTSEDDLNKAIKYGDVPEITAPVSDEWKNLIMWMLRKDPDERATIEDVNEADDTTKVKIALSVHSAISSHSGDIANASGTAVSSGLLERFCETLTSSCSEHLFVVLSSVVSLIVCGTDLPSRGHVSSLLPSLVGLSTKTTGQISLASTRTIGTLCRLSLSSQDVEGVLNSGTVEAICRQCKEGVNETASGVERLKVLDSLCTGLVSFVNKQQAVQMEKETTSRKVKKEEESRFSIISRCKAALDLIQETLCELCGMIRERGGKEGTDTTREMEKEIGGMLIRHFPKVIVMNVTKREKVIGIDIGGVREEMEEERRRVERERNEQEERRRKEVEREMKEMEEREEQRRKDFEKRMNEVRAEQETNRQLIELWRKKQKEEEEEEAKRTRQREEEKKREEERKREEEEEAERRRLSKIGAAAIEYPNSSSYSVSGNVFTSKSDVHGCFLSFEFGTVVAHLSLTIISSPIPGFTFVLGVVPTRLTQQAQTTYFFNLKGGAGWDVAPNRIATHQNGKEINTKSACLTGAAGQKIVLEADGREGKRTLKLSQNGQTQPVFFTNLPVPFRFAIHFYKQGQAVRLESTEVLKEPAMVGGSIPVAIDQ